ncbi:hypothetical protein GCM10009557_05740 [Virgisporangium ochraceum]|uniref:Uncharacterized protein n=1 Tax=Virgisporangium ochraceum TaxID=65505 RepID=A0A8J3ZRM1_9ACTN|nr:hypothetical protein [Virgisporangium ochraceum]GIJ66231.1 hypothetical protein Voc01_011480 [Virgisporangium ochraceum]
MGGAYYWGAEMSAAGIFATLLAALMVDGLSIFPQAWRDRIAFVLGLAAIREGWDGSPVDRYTVQLLSSWIDAAKATGNSTLAQAATAQILGVLVAAIAVYTAGVLMPPSWSAKAGELAKLSWSKGKGGAGPVGPPGSGGGAKFRLTSKLWMCAFLLGLMAELPKGIIGTLVLGIVTGIVNAVAPLPGVLFGVA